MEFKEHEPLAPHTTFQIGGPARFFARIHSLAELEEALAFAGEKKLPLLLLGGGSNLLINDAGFDGLVIKNEIKGIELEDRGRETLVLAGAGEPWDALVARAVEEKLRGLENLSGIPGTAGAAPVQNIGAYGAEVKDTLLWLEAYDTKTKELARFSNGECEFGYRTSIFKKHPQRFCVLRVAFLLRRDGSPNLEYRDLKEAFADDSSPALGRIREQVLAIRARKFPDLSKEGTAGSFFLNPIVSPTKAAALREGFPELPQFPADGGVKLSLAWLLDRALSLKGARHGGARLFERQPLVVAAELGTSSSDVRSLASHVIERVKTELDIDIEPEVRII